MDFEVYTANTADFLDATLVGCFTALSDGQLTNGVQVFDLLDTNARYLRIRVLSALVGAANPPLDVTTSRSQYGLSEVAFDTGPVSSTEAR